MLGAMPATSRSPLARPANLVVGSSTTLMTRPERLGGPPSSAGNSSFRRNTQRSPARRSTNRNGPFPTGCEVERRTFHVGVLRRIRGDARERSEARRTRAEIRLWRWKRTTAVLSSRATTLSIDARSVARQISRGRITRGGDGEGNVTGGRRNAVVPPKVRSEVQRQRATVGGPFPSPREVRHRRERRIVLRERDEEREALDLARQRMHRDEGIPRLEVRARRVHDDVRRRADGAQARHAAIAHETRVDTRSRRAASTGASSRCAAPTWWRRRKPVQRLERVQPVRKLPRVFLNGIYVGELTLNSYRYQAIKAPAFVTWLAGNVCRH